MAEMESLTDAHVLLLATRLCSEAKIEGLQALRTQHSDVLQPVILYRIILTFLPEAVDPFLYISLLKDGRHVGAHKSPEASVDASPVSYLTEADARIQVQGLHIQHLLLLDFEHESRHDPLVRFLIQRAHQIDVATGDLQAILHLLEPFIDDFEVLERWLISTLLPPLRKDYEYYPENEARLSLRESEALQGAPGMDRLLMHAKQHSGRAFLGRDLRGLVGPWNYGGNKSKRRKMSSAKEESGEETEARALNRSGWQEVNEWIVSTSLEDFALTSKAIEEWGGPQDVDLGGFAEVDGDMLKQESTLEYCQAAVSTIYANDRMSQNDLRDCWRILDRVADLSGVGRPEAEHGSQTLPDISAFPSLLVDLSRAALLHNALLRVDNELTKPSRHSLSFLSGILFSLRTLQGLMTTMSPRAVVEITLFASPERQQQELRKILSQFSRMGGSRKDWRLVRGWLRWLRSWRHDSDRTAAQTDGLSRRALFWKVDSQYLEKEFLSAILIANEYETAIDIYIKEASSPLSLEEIESLVIESILGSYDNASNGNRTRGGIKRAFELSKAFQPYFPEDSTIHKIEHLIAATHALSFYQLTLQYGVPFQPVSIRVHPDPVALLEKVLEQNSKAYTKLDDLLSIGRNLVMAGLPTPASPSPHSAGAETLDSELFHAERRITFLAITSALSSNDFDTAYSYILTRLSPSPLPNATTFVDDSSWRAAYAAGRHRPPSSPQSLTSRIASLSKRMELLSLALTLAPTPEPLSEILGVWRRCEEELESLRSEETEHEQAWDERGDGLVPGGFGPEGRDVDMADTRRERAKRANARRTVGTGAFEDKAPMGLFDVARGAARAIGKSAFPLRGAGGNVQIRDKARGMTGESGEDDFAQGGGEGQRVRKRDMVSNMVTGGLVSGIGWMLGAQPVENNEQA